MESFSPLAYLGRSLEQVAFVVKDLDAAQQFFCRQMGIPRFYVIRNFGRSLTDMTWLGKPAEFDAHIALAYSGDTQVELIEPASETGCHMEALKRRGEGLHHLGFFLDARDQYEKISSEFARGGYSNLCSGKMGESEFTYFDTEAAIGSIMEIVYLGRQGKELMARVKRGDF